MTRTFDRATDLERARLDPAAVFGTPEQIVEEGSLSQSEKSDLLRRWSYDARELAVAEAEGMGGGEPTLIERITAALARLEAEDAAASAPTKQG